MIKWLEWNDWKARQIINFSAVLTLAPQIWHRNPFIFTMNKTLLTVLVIAVVVSVFTEQGDAILRAGRDRIEKAPRDSKMQQRETEDVVDVPLCIMPSKEMWDERRNISILCHLYRPYAKMAAIKLFFRSYST